jgi:hypothetical protein
MVPRVSATYNRRMRLFPQTARRQEMTHAGPTELAYREGGGIEVALLWDPESDELVVTVVDGGSGDSFELSVESAYALDAFRHPYAYAARSGVPFLPPAGELVLTLPD